jgi:hypothetical protein
LWAAATATLGFAFLARDDFVFCPPLDRSFSRIKLKLFLDVTRIPAFVHRVAGILAKMQRISKVLQFSVIIERRRVLSLESELP